MSNPYYGVGLCKSCGQEWFLFVNENQTPALVTLDEKGIITGWQGKFYCVECHQEWNKEEPLLKLVPKDE